VLPLALLTGFEPYVEGLPVNPSWEIVRPLEGAEVDGFRVRAVLLPVAYGAAAAALARAVEEARPRVVVAFGMHRRGALVELERRFRFAEREGEALEPEDGGARERATRLPVERIVAALEAAGFAARASDDAGLYVCEHVGFTAIGLARRLGLAAAGFVHVPAPGELAIERQLGIPRAVLRALRAQAEVEA
jgi:pyroglutamyl-peptidase